MTGSGGYPPFARYELGAPMTEEQVRVRPAVAGAGRYIRVISGPMPCLLDSHGRPAYNRCMVRRGDDRQGRTMLVRLAKQEDEAAIWSIMEPTIRAGETYALPRDMTKADALSY